jgi:hypothetical protein
VPAPRARRLWANPCLAEPRRTILAPPVGLLVDHDPRARRKRSRWSPAASYSRRSTIARCLPRAKNAPGLDGAARAAAPGSVGIWSRGLNRLEVRDGTCARCSPCAVLTTPSIVGCRARCGLTDSLALSAVAPERQRWRKVRRHGAASFGSRAARPRRGTRAPVIAPCCGARAAVQCRREYRGACSLFTNAAYHTERAYSHAVHRVPLFGVFLTFMYLSSHPLSCSRTLARALSLSLLAPAQRCACARKP